MHQPAALLDSPESAVSLRLAQAVQKAEARFHALIENCQNGVCIIAGLRFVQVNGAFAEMLGYRPEELVGKFWRDVLEATNVPLMEGLFERLHSDVTMPQQGLLHFCVKGGADRREVSVRMVLTDYAGEAAYLATTYDVTDLRRGEMALHDYARRLRHLSQQVLEVQENERRHIARELHDEIGQQLTLTKLSLHLLEKQQSRHPEALADALAHVTSLMTQVRNLSLDLRPSMLDDLGLVPALRWYAGRATTLADIALVIEVDPDFPRLRPEAETLYFRVAQEAITNTLRHAAATCLRIALAVTREQVLLTIADNGRGFDPGRAAENAARGGSAGLLGMQERAALGGAELGLESRPGHGANLSLVMPRMRAVIQTVLA